MTEQENTDSPVHRLIDHMDITGENRLMCACGVRIWPDCDMSRASIAEAFERHVDEGPPPTVGEVMGWYRDGSFWTEPERPDGRPSGSWAYPDEPTIEYMLWWLSVRCGGVELRVDYSRPDRWECEVSHSDVPDFACYSSSFTQRGAVEACVREVAHYLEMAKRTYPQASDGSDQ